MWAGVFTVTSAAVQDGTLSPSDVSVNNRSNPGMVKVHLKQRKTDPFRHGVDIFLGCTDTTLYPVAAILAYYAIRPAVPGPFFIFQDCSPLTRDRSVAHGSGHFELLRPQFQGGCAH